MHPTQSSDKEKRGTLEFLPIGQYAHRGALIGQGPFFFLFINFSLPEDHFHEVFMYICFKTISFNIYNLYLKMAKFAFFAIFAYTRTIFFLKMRYFSHIGGASIFFYCIHHMLNNQKPEYSNEFPILPPYDPPY